MKSQITRREAVASAVLAAVGLPPPSMTALLDEHNRHRGIKLQIHKKLMDYAQSHAAWMAKSGRMTHSSMSEISKLGFSPVAENIAWGQDSVDEVMGAWMRSPGHRRNITNESLDSFGGGVAMKEDRIYWCCVFGKLRESSAFL